MKKIYRVALSGEEEAELQALISRGKTAARRVTRARILLLAHAGEKDGAVARALQTSVSTVERTRKNLVLEGLKAALEEAPRPGAKPQARRPGPRPSRRPGVQHAAGGPGGLDPGTARRQAGGSRSRGELFQGGGASGAEKNALKPWLHKQWSIPTPGAEFVWRMEEVISLYTEEGEADPLRPYVCFDETSKQLVAETKPALAAPAWKAGTL